MKILILCAMDKELQMFSSLTQNKISNNNNIFAFKCGIGKVNAGVNAYKYIKDYQPDIVISTGVAGGCSENIKIMDVVIAQKLCYHDVWCGKPNVLGQIQGCPAEFVVQEEILNKIKALRIDSLHYGNIVSGDCFVDSPEKMYAIKQNFPNAIAVDMESAAIAQVCNMMKIPFLSIRIISDLPLQNNNHQQYNDFWTNLADKSFEITKKIILSL